MIVLEAKVPDISSRETESPKDGSTCAMSLIAVTAAIRARFSGDLSMSRNRLVRVFRCDSVRGQKGFWHGFDSGVEDGFHRSGEPYQHCQCGRNQVLILFLYELGNYAGSNSGVC